MRDNKANKAQKSPHAHRPPCQDGGNGKEQKAAALYRQAQAPGSFLPQGQDVEVVGKKEGGQKTAKDIP